MLFNMPIRKIKIGLLVLIGVLVAALVPASVIGRNRLVPATDLNTSVSDGLGVGMVCSPNGPTFNLETTTGYFSAPDGNQVYMWGFTESGDDFQMPGPVLCVNQGDTVTINLTNTFDSSVHNDPVSIVFPGQMGVTTIGGSSGLFTAEAAPDGGTVTYEFTAGNPGTYLYESGTAQHKQIEMGLYGALIVRPALDATYAADDRHFAYNDEATEYKEEYLLVMHEIDPVLHAIVERHEVEPYDITTRHDRYWTLNGRSFPDIVAPNGADWLPGQPYSGLVLVEAHISAQESGDPYYDPDFKPALIRYANAGLENHPFHPHGNTMQVIGRDGRQLTNPLENFTTTVGSGQTYDLLFRWEDKDGWDPVTNPLPVPNPNAPPDPDVGPIPDYLNRVYKDGYTFFSGSPYLGDPGPNDYFPVGTTEYNVCGEFYFPWHSHALNEIQNFDEGFGGMLTLVGVFPPQPSVTSGLPDPCAAVRLP